MKILNDLFIKTKNKCIPLICTFELIEKCNLKCRHCYLAEKRAPLLSTKLIIQTLKTLKSLGCLYLTFTGGEVFLRKDIIKLVKTARNLKFDLRIFTNATMIDENIAKSLNSAFVSAIEISVYGKEKTHDRLTQVPGSFKKTFNAIEILKKHHIPVVIKTPAMKSNFNDLKWLKNKAKKLKVTLKIDPIITPKNNGDSSFLSERLGKTKLNAILSEYSDNGFNQDIILPYSDNALCSAAKNLIAIDASGNVLPCLQLPINLGNIKKSPLSKIWNKRNKRLSTFRSINITDIKECFKCSLLPYCQRCPGLAMIEDKDLYGPSKIACTIAKIKASKNPA